MSPLRLVLKTHREVSRPGLFIALITHCTKPNESTFADTVGDCMSRYFPKPTQKKERGSLPILDKTGGKYCAWMGQYFGFLTDNLFWSPKGWTIKLISREVSNPRDYIELSESERALLFAYYVEAQGPLILKLSELIASRGEVTRRELIHAKAIDEAILSIYREYLQRTDDLAERTTIRHKMERLERRGYDPNTRPHKSDPLLFPLRDFGIVSTEEFGDDVVFRPVKDRISALLSSLRDIPTIERRLSASEGFEIVREILFPSARLFAESSDKDSVVQAILFFFREASDRLSLVSIRTIADAVAATSLPLGVLTPISVVEKLLDELAGQNAMETQFHVDYRGKRSFVQFSPTLVNRLLRPSGPKA